MKTSSPLPYRASEMQGSQAIAAWKHWMSTLYGLESDVYGDREFSARLGNFVLGNIGMTKIEAGRHRVRRTSDVLATQQTDFLKIVAPWQGMAVVSQNGRQAQVRPGLWTIYDSTQEYEVANPERCEHLIITLPKSRFNDNGRAVASLMGSYVGGSHGVSRIALDVMRGLYQECSALDDGMVRHLTDTLVHLVQLSLMEACGRNAALSPAELLNERIKAYVRQHVRNTDLSVDEIAQALNCSKRHLYNAFTHEPSSISQFIWQERIALFQRELQHPHWQQRTITELALACGFSSSAHFSRMFKQQTGLSPVQYKQQLSAATPEPLRH